MCGIRFNEHQKHFFFIALNVLKFNDKLTDWNDIDFELWERNSDGNGREMCWGRGFKCVSTRRVVESQTKTFGRLGSMPSACVCVCVCVWVCECVSVCSSSFRAKEEPVGVCVHTYGRRERAGRQTGRSTGPLSL